MYGVPVAVVLDRLEPAPVAEAVVVVVSQAHVTGLLLCRTRWTGGFFFSYFLNLIINYTYLSRFGTQFFFRNFVFPPPPTCEAVRRGEDVSVREERAAAEGRVAPVLEQAHHPGELVPAGLAAADDPGMGEREFLLLPFLLLLFLLLFLAVLYWYCPCST